MRLFHIVLSHGRESGPNARKITQLAQLAEQRGHNTLRPDYGTSAPPEVRLAQLIGLISEADRPVILVGSSLGAYISGLASLQTQVHGLFLLAPPVFFRGEHAPIALRAARTSIVHGWRDELIDPGEVVALARAYRAELLLLDDDHRLSADIAKIGRSFVEFLTACEADA